MTALLVIALVVAVVGLMSRPSSEATSAPAAKPSPVKPPRPYSATHCPGSRAAIRFYRAAFSEHRQAMGLDTAPVFVRERCGTARRRATEWRSKAYKARLALASWVAYQYRWEQWLPSNWQALGACETGYGRRPGNWNHSNGSFVSAFGISRSIYDSDAAYMGAPPWDDRNPPTPRQQYLAALGHYKRFGDGWGCPGP